MIGLRVAALCAVTVAVALTAGCNEKCKHHQISTEDWSDRCLEYETSERGPSRPDEVETPLKMVQRWLPPLGRDPRPNHPADADSALLPRSTASAGPDQVGVNVHAYR